MSSAKSRIKVLQSFDLDEIIHDFGQAPKNRRRIDKTNRVLFGTRSRNGVLFTVFVYVLLISLGFVYLYPMLHMIITSVKSLPDLLDPSVNWIPTELSLDNFKKAFQVMNFKDALFDTIQIALFPTIAQTAVCALTGYGLARYAFPGRNAIIALALLTFIVPPYVLMIPTYTMYSDYGILGSILTLVLPAVTGQGLKSALFVLIFMQFFRQTPLSLDEAARVDGCSEWRIFYNIALPLAVPAFVVTFLFSFVWYWNESYFTVIYMSATRSAAQQPMTTLLMELTRFEQSYSGYLQSTSGTWGAAHMAESAPNEAIKMAATLITVLPMLIVYFILQKQFVESIDRTGITGE